MSHSSRDGRRKFLTHLAATTAMAGATAALPGAAVAELRAEDSTEAQHEHDKWIDALKGEYRIVLDSVSPKGATEIGGYASTYLAVNQGAYGFGADKSSLVVIVRNMAASFGFNDTVWSNYGIGEILAFDDPRTKARAMRNAAAPEFAALAKQGAVIAVCGMATQYVSGLIARTRSLNATEVRQTLEANLLPGARIVPSGITTVDRCQRARFSYAYVG